MKHWLFLLSLFTALPSFGQYVVRNGGYTVQCVNSPIKVLEIVEAESKGIPIRYSPARSYVMKSRDLIARIGIVNSEKAKKYLSWLEQWKGQVKWMATLDQYSPNDEGVIRLPSSNCRIRVGIVQINETRFGHQEYWINPSVWLSMSEDQKAALVLHELIYRDLLEENPNANSSYVRIVNAKVHSVDIYNEQKTFADLINAL